MVSLHPTFLLLAPNGDRVRVRSAYKRDVDDNEEPEMDVEMTVYLNGIRRCGGLVPLWVRLSDADGMEGTARGS